ncbi:GGDEF domain-containing protein [Paenibacillus tengchongensis]|uniref:GGDEF domain-containing protein n=1 Tax=Paenibacillus tengchongensis TaxID=2608684 RepID=UPI00124ED8B6|nr:GGDEF domain-containing protein [Paenibacillus tengchongensis]
MEEARNYLFIVCTVLIAAAAAYGMLWLSRHFAGKDSKTRAVRTSLNIAAAGGALCMMHLLGKQTISGFVQPEGSQIVVMGLYALTIAGFLWLFSWTRRLLAEREQLKELAYKDTLTGLMNKNGMEHFWNRCKPGEQLAVFYMDLNRFKSINDSMGHHIGDLLLQAVGGSLQQFSLKNKRHIFRVGGDEFVIIAKRCGRKEAERLAVQIMERVNGHYLLEQHNVYLSVSIGVTLSQGKVDRARLLKEADSAMYSAKQLGKGRYAVYRQGNPVQPVPWLGSSKAN